MRIGRAMGFGVLGAFAITVITALLRGVGLQIHIEMIIGTLFGVPPSSGAFVLGFLVHLIIGGIFGVVYGALFERVWKHGGAPTGMILGFLHALFIGMLFGFTPQFHPLIPEAMVDPGPYFSHAGIFGPIMFFFVHIVYGAIVGAGYGNVAAEHAWAPTGRA